MKKLIAALFAFALCATANAASVDWGVSRKSFRSSDGSSDQAANYYIAVFLYEDLSAVNTALQSLGTEAETSMSTLNSLEVSHGVTNTRGAADGSFNTTEASGTLFTLFTVAFDAKTIAEAGNYLVSDKSLSNAYVAPDNPDKIGTFDSSSYSSSEWKPIAAVPEPSTAALALAGLALILKRRKA